MMGISKPYKRTYRQFADGTYGEKNGNWMYITHPQYACAPEHYIRAFNLIQKDLLHIFDYIEPSEINSNCYSYRLHELHTRTCIEIEANLKAIMRANLYHKSGNLTMHDYRKLEATHRLSGYQVRLPLWDGAGSTKQPFSPWMNGHSLPWYQAYNGAKHDRYANFKQANVNHLVEAVCGLVVVLSAQFGTNDFSDKIQWVNSMPANNFLIAIGSYFQVLFPTDWPTDQRYDFSWADVERSTEPFATLIFQ
jgi:hypothetical protein